MTYFTLPFGPMLTPSRNWVSKNTFLPESALKSIVATARSTASDTTSCSVARRDLLIPQPAESRAEARAASSADRADMVPQSLAAGRARTNVGFVRTFNAKVRRFLGCDWTQVFHA